jgi:polyisoprenoid-binding protein YceI
VKRKNQWVWVVVLAAIAIVAGIWLYNWVLGDTEEASGPINATPVVLETAAPTSIPPTATTASLPTAAEPTVSADPTLPAASEAPASAPATNLVVYKISQEESQVLFNIFEELRGAPKDVIGVSNQVAGEIAVDLNDLSTAKAGVFQINARTLVTDDDRRNQAIRNRILNTDQYEFITFTPTQITGLSGSAVPGQTFTFQIAGDLTIRDITKPVVFEVTGQLESPERLTGTAKTVIQREDFALVVPDLPFIANVSPQVALQIDMVLVPAN